MMEGKDLLYAVGGIDESIVAKNSQVYNKKEHHYAGIGIAACFMLGVIAIAAVVNANKANAPVKEEIQTVSKVLEIQTVNNTLDNAKTDESEESKLTVREVEILGENVGVIEDAFYELKVKNEAEIFSASQISNVDRNRTLQTALESLYLEGSDGKVYDSDDLKYVVSIDISINTQAVNEGDSINEKGMFDIQKISAEIMMLRNEMQIQEEDIINEFERLKESNDGIFLLEPAGIYYNDDYSSCKIISQSKILAVLSKKTIANLVTNQDYRYSLRLESYKGYEDLMAMNYKAEYTAQEKTQITGKVTDNNKGN